MVLDETIDWLSLHELYAKHPWTIDGLVYLVLFVGLSKVTIGRRFRGPGGPAVSGAFGFALAVGATTFGVSRGFTLGALGPVAWLALLVVIGVFLFDLLRFTGLGVMAAGAASILVLGATGSGFGLVEVLTDTGLASLFGLVMLLAVLVLVWRIFSGHRGEASVQQGHHVKVHRTAEEDAVGSATIERVEASIMQLLGNLERHLMRQGCDHRAASMLDEIRRRERIVKQLYARALRVLARERWNVGDHVESNLRRALLAAQENISAFERACDILHEAISAGNTPLALQAVRKMIELETDGIRIAQGLRELLRRVGDGRGRS